MYLSQFISSTLESLKRVVNINLFGNQDPRSAVEVGPFGVDSSPRGKDLFAVYAKTGRDGDEIILGYINKQQIAQRGEMRIYSMASDNDYATDIILRADGTIEVGGYANHMTQFEGLQTAFNQLRSDFNALVTLYNAHVHSGGTLAGGFTGTTTTGGTSSTADILPAKLTNIKTQ